MYISSAGTLPVHRPVTPSCRMMCRIVASVPVYSGAVAPPPTDSGSEREDECDCSWSRILTTSRGAMTQLSPRHSNTWGSAHWGRGVWVEGKTLPSFLFWCLGFVCGVFLCVLFVLV